MCRVTRKLGTYEVTNQWESKNRRDTGCSIMSVQVFCSASYAYFGQKKIAREIHNSNCNCYRTPCRSNSPSTTWKRRQTESPDHWNGEKVITVFFLDLSKHSVVRSDVNVDLDFLGQLDDLGQLDGETRGLLQVWNGQDPQARGGNQHFGFVNFAALTEKKVE